MAEWVKCPTLAQVVISTVGEFKPRVRLCADRLEAGACFGFCVSFSLCPSLTCALSLSLSKINKLFYKSQKKMTTSHLIT